MALSNKLGLGLNLDSFVGLHMEEKEEGLMPYSFSMPKASSKQQVHVLEESMV
jgi:hypothetical protein